MEYLPIITEARLKLGLERLLTAPLDLKGCGARIYADTVRAHQPSEHKYLFQAYTKELKEVIPEARRIWRAIVAECLKKAHDPERATVDALNFQPAGSAFDGRVIAVVRKYWLACDSLNSRIEENIRVSPQVFLLAWLVEVDYREAVEVLAGMPYWPIGLDQDGKWV